MSLECLDYIILDNLAIYVDLSDIRSWNYNTGLTAVSLTKWNGAISDSLTLKDFGLTGYDNGFLNNMLSGLTLTPNDNKFKFYRIGYNTSGGTQYSGYSLTSVSGTSVGNYFYANGGYLQGFFKLDGYNYETFPPRYNKGITIETIIELLQDSKGIFYLMGTRAEDKYNPYFSGETTIIGVTGVTGGSKNVEYKYKFSGITTSEGHYLNAYNDTTIVQSNVKTPENIRTTVEVQSLQLNNIKNNVIAFEITADRRIGYKYIDENGVIIQNASTSKLRKIGWTIISIVFTPDSPITNYDPSMYQCYKRRTGTLTVFVNGRKFWQVKDFLEWYSSPLENDREKQLGVPFIISWGGGSFGLKHSYHFTSGDTNSTLVKDDRKNNLTIEKNFNDSYIGNIQKLRVYNDALTSDKILHNAIIETQNNGNYNIFVNKGGRIIYNELNRMNISQQTSGSDIRKSIRYRNTDGSYRNLFDMTDIKVVVKSRSNPSVELVKFKKVAEAGWLALIPVDYYIYDFIVGNEITKEHPNEILYAEIMFQWADPYDIDHSYEKVFVTNLLTTPLIDNSVKKYI